MYVSSLFCGSFPGALENPALNFTGNFLSLLPCDEGLLADFHAEKDGFTVFSFARITWYPFFLGTCSVFKGESVVSWDPCGISSFGSLATISIFFFGFSLSFSFFFTMIFFFPLEASPQDVCKFE